MSNIGTKFILANRFTFDPNSNSLIDQEGDGEIVRLGSNESRILLLLAERPSEVISRNQLHEFVWRDQGFEVDDSSLTQAISTLRKMLKDSTKSPMFVKTVPKRGYQLICTVDRGAPLLSNESNEREEPSKDENVTRSVSEDVILEPVNTTIEPIQVESQTKEKSKDNNWLMKTTLLFAVLIPICVMLFTTPNESTFKQIAVFDDIPILMPNNHPNLEEWLPSIKICVNKYNESSVRNSKPIEIIATGGQTNKLVLNYIHSLENQADNISFRIIAKQQDLSDVCK